MLDVTKYAAARLGLPMVAVATNLAHDGIGSPVAILDNDRGRGSYGVPAPIAVLVDLDLVRRAPRASVAAGIGEAISNLSAVADWELAHEVTGEAIDGLAVTMSRTAARSLLHDPGSLDSDAFLAQLAEALVLSGLAMVVAGTSRPCSGACHEISHAIDLLHPDRARGHGEQVGVGGAFATWLRGDHELCRHDGRGAAPPRPAGQPGRPRLHRRGVRRDRRVRAADPSGPLHDPRAPRPRPGRDRRRCEGLCQRHRLLSCAGSPSPKACSAGAAASTGPGGSTCATCRSTRTRVLIATARRAQHGDRGDDRHRAARRAGAAAAGRLGAAAGARCSCSSTCCSTASTARWPAGPAVRRSAGSTSTGSGTTCARRRSWSGSACAPAGSRLGGYAMLGTLAALGVVLIKAETDLVDVARARAGLPAAEDASAAPRSLRRGPGPPAGGRAAVAPAARRRRGVAARARGGGRRRGPRRPVRRPGSPSSCSWSWPACRWSRTW